MTLLLDMLQPGMRIFLPGSTAEPTALLDAVLCDPSRSAGLNILTSFVPGINRFDFDRWDSSAHIVGLFGRPHRGEVGGAVYRNLPVSYSGFATMLAIDPKPIDLAVVQVALPGNDGCCSMGLAAEFMPSVLTRARRTVALLNPNMPDLPGSPRVRIDQFAAMIETGTALPTYIDGDIDDVTDRIARHIAPFVVDGATLQSGLGKIPTGLLRCLCDRRGLRLHSGMYGGGVRVLAEAGALDPIAEHRACVAVGSPEFYDWLSGRGEFRIDGCELTHDMATLCAIPRFVAINSAIEVDLFGQCALEHVAGQSVSGAGGAPDFARAARLCRDGLSVVALPATAGREQRSRIVSRLAAPAIATLARTEIDIIVTEHGAADLRFLTVEERADALIAIAAPQHRTTLTDGRRG